MIVTPQAPNLLLRVIWFLLVGWWLGGVLSAVAWFLNATIIGLPIGLYLINRLPTFITLRPQDQTYIVRDGELISSLPQRAFILRALYFVLVGWWFSAIWMAVAYVLVVSIIGIPFAFWMYGRVGAVTTLFRS